MLNKKQIMTWGLCALMSFPILAANLTGEIEGFSLYSCGIKICFKIEAGKALIGKMGGDYAFDSATVTLLDINSQKEQVLVSNDLFYDVRQKRLLIRNAGPEDYMFDVEEQKLISYRR
jgi:hypothetical protein